MAYESKHARKPVTPEERRAKRQALREKKERKKKSKGFRTFMFIWIALIVAFGAYALLYVRGILKEMQANTPSQFISDRLVAMSDEQIKSLFDFNGNIDEGNQTKNVKQFFKDGNYTVKQVMGTEDYNVYNGERKVLTVSLNKLRSVSKLALFNYNIYELGRISPSEEKELYHYEITAPSDCTVLVNGKETAPTSVAKLEYFSDASNYIDLPSQNSFMLDHLTKPADIKITRDGKELTYKKGEKITIDSGYDTFASLEEAGCDFDLIGFAENWSKYMTKDLTGKRYGFYTIAESLIEKSEMYQKAWNWATGIDITFVSVHTLAKPPFSEQTISNVVKYSDDAISADVHLVKHMLIRGTSKHDDKNDSTFYLIKQDGAWKVVNIRGKVTE